MKPAQHFLSPPVGRLSCAKLSPDTGGDFLFTRLRRHDIGVDGRIFWKHQPSSKNGQRWCYQWQMNRASALNKKAQRARRGSDGSRKRFKNPMASKVATRLLLSTQSAVARQIVRMPDICNDIGCSRDELCDYIESLFLDGMSWENFNEWHIDHIKPLSSFNMLDAAERSKANHFSNLQPLWAIDNLKKGNRV